MKIEIRTGLLAMSFVIAQSLAAQNLIAHYPFANSPNDVSGNQYNGIVKGATITTDRFGNSNMAYSFNGLNNEIAISYPAFKLNKFTYSAWVYLNVTPSSGQYMSILSLGGSTNDQVLLVGNNSAMGHIGFGVGSWSTNGISNSIYKGTVPSTGQWYNLIATRGLDSIIFYLDGFRIGGRNVNGQIPGYSPGLTGSIGSRVGNIQYFNGKIDDIRIYDFAMSPSEVDVLVQTMASDSIATGLRGNNNVKTSFVSIFPNPSHGSIRIVNESNEQILKLRISDIVGETVREMDILGADLNIDNLRPGIYFCQIEKERSLLQTVKILIAD